MSFNCIYKNYQKLHMALAATVVLIFTIAVTSLSCIKPSTCHCWNEPYNDHWHGWWHTGHFLRGQRHHLASLNTGHFLRRQKHPLASLNTRHLLRGQRHHLVSVNTGHFLRGQRHPLTSFNAYIPYMSLHLSTFLQHSSH